MTDKPTAGAVRAARILEAEGWIGIGVTDIGKVSEIISRETHDRDLIEAVYDAIPGYITTGEAGFDRLLKLCRAYEKATGEKHPADRWTQAEAAVARKL